jgi:hypothetical protein
MSKIIWCLKQLFPLTYWSYYQECSGSVDGNPVLADMSNAKFKQYFTIWHMWFGKVYDAVTVEINDYFIGGKMQAKEFAEQIKDIIEKDEQR